MSGDITGRLYAYKQLYTGCVFYRLAQHGSFIAQKASFRRDVANINDKRHNVHRCFNYLCFPVTVRLLLTPLLLPLQNKR